MTDMTYPNGPSLLLAYVTDFEHRHPEGLILESTGGFAHQRFAEQGSVHLEDYKVTRPPRNGLLVLDGWVDWEPDDHGLVGEWRPLSFHELNILRHGGRLFQEEDE
jgi:hypothetical protein